MLVGISSSMEGTFRAVLMDFEILNIIKFDCTVHMVRDRDKFSN